MRFLNPLYKIERTAAERALDYQARYEPAKSAKPILEDFKRWLEAVYPTVLPKFWAMRFAIV